MKIHKETLKSLILLLSLCIILFTAVLYLDTVEIKYNLRQDFSFNAYATTSKETQNALSKINKKINIYMIGTEQSKDVYLYELVKRYESVNSHISSELIDLARRPLFAKQFEGSLSNPLSQESLIVHCTDTNRYKILKPSDFVALDFDVETGKYKFNGLLYEKSLTEAILYVSSDYIPTVYISTGHGEFNNSDLTSLIDYLNGNAYQSNFIKIASDDMAENSILLLPSIKKDLSQDELQKIKSFESNGGNIIIGFDYTDDINTMPNLNSLINSYGISVLDGFVMADKNDKASYYKEPLYILPFMQNCDMLKPLIDNNRDILLMPGSKAFEFLSSSLPYQQKLLLSGKTATLQNGENKSHETIGEYILCALNNKQHSNGNISKLLVLGNTLSVVDSYLYTTTFVSDFVQQILNYMLPQRLIDISIAVKPALRPELRPQSFSVGISIIVLIPILVFTVAIVVLNKRKSL